MSERRWMRRLNTTRSFWRAMRTGCLRATMARRWRFMILAIWGGIGMCIDDPRYVLAQTGTLIEPPRTRENSFCCGAGGGLVFLGEEGGSQRMNHERAQELIATGAEVIATACPFCTASLREARDASDGRGETAPPFLDIAEIVAEQIRT